MFGFSIQFFPATGEFLCHCERAHSKLRTRSKLHIDFLLHFNQWVLSPWFIMLLFDHYRLFFICNYCPGIFDFCRERISLWIYQPRWLPCLSCFAAFWKWLIKFYFLNLSFLTFFNINGNSAHGSIKDFSVCLFLDSDLKRCCYWWYLYRLASHLVVYCFYYLFSFCLISFFGYWDALRFVIYQIISWFRQPLNFLFSFKGFLWLDIRYRFSYPRHHFYRQSFLLSLQISFNFRFHSLINRWKFLLIFLQEIVFLFHLLFIVLEKRLIIFTFFLY